MILTIEIKSDKRKTKLFYIRIRHIEGTYTDYILMYQFQVKGHVKCCSGYVVVANTSISELNVDVRYLPSFVKLFPTFINWGVLHLACTYICAFCTFDNYCAC